jgi:hypothetical protein
MKRSQNLEFHTVVFFFIFLIPVYSVAQNRVLRIEKMANDPVDGSNPTVVFDVNIKSTDGIKSTDVRVHFYQSNFSDSLEFNPINNKGSLKSKIYNHKEKRWELFFSSESIVDLELKAFNFRSEKLTIDNREKSIVSYQVSEVSSNSPPKLTLTSNIPDAKFTISYSSGGINLEGTFINGRKDFENIPAGTISILVEKKGYSSIVKTITLKNGNKLSEEINLEPLKKYVQIESKPSESKFFFDTNPNKLEKTPYNDSIPGNTKKLTFKNEYFEDISLDLPAESSFKTEVELNRKRSKIYFTDNSIDNILIDAKPLPKIEGRFQQAVPMGEYLVRVEMGNLKAFEEKNYPFKEETENLAELQSKWRNYFYIQKVEKNEKSLRTVSFSLALAGIGSGIYFMQSANKNYAAYKNASSSTDAASLRKQVESADRLSPIALSAGGLFAGIGIYFSIK